MNSIRNWLHGFWMGMPGLSWGRTIPYTGGDTQEERNQFVIRGCQGCSIQP